ncbi:hypothetical protein KFK09_011723 [Dendrobium nobile]|uniref:DUF4283 domain-containing protein n=1 Tax=Dendrobium nobile TaxID=94219 RepID=A0A8T3BGN0_DENNO|nr:hypothetical protein KFK09_011723 [Dendrobium nobile]
MRLLKWTPDFDVREESPIAPVWISFPNLRLHFFNQQILFGMASIFGRPLQTDQATATVSRPSVARVLVELDVSKKHPTEIWIGSENKGYFQKIDFKNLPIFCSYCKMHGHGVNECFRKHPHLRPDKKSVKESIEIIGNVNEKTLLKEPLLELRENKTVEDEPSLVVLNDVPNVVNDLQVTVSVPLVNVSIGEEILVDHAATISKTITTCITDQNNLDPNVIMNSDSINVQDSRKDTTMTIPMEVNEGAKCGLSLEEGEIAYRELISVPIYLLDDRTKNVTDNWEEDGRFMEDDSPNACKSPSKSHYNSDTTSDKEEFNCSVKCYTKDDLDSSFIKIQSKKGREPKHITWQPARSNPKNSR